VTNARRRAGFAKKTMPRRFITEVSHADDFQCHGAVQIDVDRFVSDPHRTATQFDRIPVLTLDQLIVLKSSPRLFWCRLDRILGSRRLARLSPANEGLAKHADRTEFHCSRKLIATDRAGALGFRAHGLTDLRMRCIQLYEILVSSSFKAASTVDLIREVVPERGAQGRPEFTFEPAQLG
jgi:hypothetical protein